MDNLLEKISKAEARTLVWAKGGKIDWPDDGGRKERFYPPITYYANFNCHYCKEPILKEYLHYIKKFMAGKAVCFDCRMEQVRKRGKASKIAGFWGN